MRVLLALVITIASVALITGVAASTPNAPPEGLTVRGRALWQFEALLRDTFGNQQVCTAAPNNFVGGTCTPLARYRPYFYVFADARNSALHVSQRTASGLGSFNRPGPVLIRNRLIACNKRETRILWAFSLAAGFAVECLPKP
jgi:hypothetical protein